ncbi:T9SS type A sorting domain-containing protein [Aequorivita todarodis]|uniref:T9SS type A sorting domain-containing protein n=1 Tax=Aequorivita todarodis TaxID=2036821 RepID=UPI0023510073|nr:T9SS type A sorting domain-containing protein [Aequorivita todarodis]MDC8001810.1 T9SS type A sorting domain-containing protein [Aequorivita todarodis]
MKNYILIGLILFYGIATYAQSDIQWQKSIGGSDRDNAFSIQQTNDGGYIIAGSSKSNDGDVTNNHGDYDVWIVKLNDIGEIQWEHSYGGSGYDSGRSVKQTSDGGYIILADSESNDGDVDGNQGDKDAWIFKLDPNGNIQWQKSYGGSNTDGASSVQQTADGGFIVAAYAYSIDGDIIQNLGYCDYWILKLDINGAIQWQKSYGGTDVDIPTSIQQTTDGGYIVGGETFSNDGNISGFHGESDYWVIKLNSNGDFVWQKTLGGSDIEYADKIQQTNEGGYIVSGYAFSFDGDISENHGASDYWVVKLNSTGNIEWQKALGGSSNEYNGSIQQTTDTGYIVTSYTYSNDGDVSGNHGNTDAWVVKLDNDGNIQWQKSMGGTDTDGAWTICQTTDGGFITAGWSNSNDGDVTQNHGQSDYWIVKLTNDGLGFADLNTDTSNFNLYPNPTKKSFFIDSRISIEKISIYNSFGKLVKSYPLQNGYDISELSAGVYIIYIETNKGTITKKSIKE